MFGPFDQITGEQYRVDVETADGLECGLKSSSAAYGPGVQI